MNLHNYDIIYALLICISLSCASNNHVLKVTKTGIKAVKPDSVGLNIFAEVLNNSTENLDVEFYPEKCCLEVWSQEDCDVLDLVVGYAGDIPAGETKKLSILAPLISPTDRKGYCKALLYSRATNNKRNAKINNITINFDTNTPKKHYFRHLFIANKSGDTDEHCLNNKPITCETYYNGKRSYYDEKVKRCAQVPECFTNEDQELASVIYDPVTNKCKESAVNLDDIHYVKELTRERKRRTKGIAVVKENRPNVKHDNRKIEIPHKKIIVRRDKSHKPKSAWISIANPLEGSSNMVSVLIVIIALQCCLLCSLAYYLTKGCCCKKKELVSQYYNYRQDASVTTPLIATSNIDTDTTDYQFVSESSNVDKKIKCYKACQNKINNAKVSLSDDILSKCLHRRDWKAKPVKSEAVEYKIIKEEKLSDFSKVIDTPKLPEVHKTVNSKKSSDVKVSTENEKVKSVEKKSTTKSARGVMKDSSSKGSKVKKTERTELNDSDIALSEQEIKCHSYNYMESNLNSRKASDETYGTAAFNPFCHQVNYFKAAPSEKGVTTSASTERGAQASFSYDSIDNYLSERGISYLVGEGISKYSLSTYSNSNDTKLSGLSGASSKTSKNNVVKNVLSLLTRKKHKHSPSSYPREKSREPSTLELIHMSKASVYTSSNNDSDCLRSFRRLKDSRSTL